MKERMTSLERVMAVLMGRRPDGIPVNPFILGFAAKICEIPIGDLYADAKKGFGAQLLCAEMYGYDAEMYACAFFWSLGVWWKNRLSIRAEASCPLHHQTFGVNS